MILCCYKRCHDVAQRVNVMTKAMQGLFQVMFLHICEILCQYFNFSKCLFIIG